MPITLQVDDGQNVRSMRMAEEKLTVGSARGAGVRVRSSGVVDEHAIVRRIGSAIEVTELGAPLEVRGTAVERAMISPGESFLIGRARITLLAASEPRPTAPLVAPENSLARTGKAPTPLPGTRKTGETAIRPALAGPEPQLEFDEQLYAMLQKAPWFATSIVLHALFLFALTLMELGPRLDRDPHPEALIVVSEGTADDALDDAGVEIEEHDFMEEFEPSPETPNPLEVLELPDPNEIDATDAPLDDPRIAAGDAVPLPELGVTTLGIGATARGADRLGATFGVDNAGMANARAAHALGSDPFGRRLLQGLRLRLSAATVKVLVSRKDYDDCATILDELDLPHGTITHADLADKPAPAELRVILYNCTPHPLPERALDHLEQFVARGGYLFTTDWGIENVLEKRFSQYIRAVRKEGRVTMTEDEVVTVQPQEHRLMRGVPDDSAISRWWLENSSFLIDIVDERSVEVLVRSRDLKNRHEEDVVAVTFRHGEGRVVHVLGHFFQKAGNLRGAYAMQRLLVNFLHEPFKR